MCASCQIARSQGLDFYCMCKVTVQNVLIQMWLDLDINCFFLKYLQANRPKMYLEQQIQQRTFNFMSMPLPLLTYVHAYFCSPLCSCKIMNSQIKHKLSQDNGLPIASVDNFPEKSRACFGKLHQIHLLGIPFHYRVSAVHLWGGLITGLPLNGLSQC